MPLTPLIILILASSAAVTARKLPPGITPCSKHDPHLEACGAKNANAAMSHIAKGNPSYGLPPMDPLFVPEFVMDDSGSRRQVAIVLAMKDLNITGLRHLNIKKFTANLTSGEVSWAGVAPRLEIIGQYNVTGRVLVLPIRGHGDLNLTLEDVDFLFRSRLQQTSERKGLKYVTPVDNNLDFKSTRGYIYLDNLFGDRALSKQMNVFLNENWPDLESELGPALGEVLKEATRQVVTAITRHVPWEEMFPDIPISP